MPYCHGNRFAFFLSAKTHVNKKLIDRGDPGELGGGYCFVRTIRLRARYDMPLSLNPLCRREEVRYAHLWRCRCGREFRSIWSNVSATSHLATLIYHICCLDNVCFQEIKHRGNQQATGAPIRAGFDRGWQINSPISYSLSFARRVSHDTECGAPEAATGKSQGSVASAPQICKVD